MPHNLVRTDKKNGRRNVSPPIRKILSTAMKKCHTGTEPVNSIG